MVKSILNDNNIEGAILAHTVTLDEETTSPTTIAYKFLYGSVDLSTIGTIEFTESVVFDVANSTITIPAGVSSFSIIVQTIDDYQSGSDGQYFIIVGDKVAKGSIYDNNSLDPTKKINWSDIVGEKTLENGGYMGDLMYVAREHLNDALENGELLKKNIGSVYSAIIPNMAGKAIEFALRKNLTETQYNELALNGISRRKIEATQLISLNEDVRKKDKENDILESTEQDRINQVIALSNKAAEEHLYVKTQKESLEKSIRFNNIIKSIAALADTYGTYGAAKVNMTPKMWEFYYTLIKELSNSLNNFIGYWDATTPFPGPADGVEEGDYYKVNVSGTESIDGEDSWSEGDYVVYVGGRWKKSVVSLTPDDTDQVSVLS